MGTVLPNQANLSAARITEAWSAQPFEKLAMSDFSAKGLNPFERLVIFDFSAKAWNRWAKILCGMSVLFLLIGAVSAVYRWNYLSDAITTQATITDLIEREGKDGDTLYAPVYVFTDQDGQSVKVISSSASYPPPGMVGDQIEVLYDPKNSQHSIQNRFFSVWGLAAITSGLGAFDFIVFGAVAFFTGRHLKKKAAQDGPPAGIGRLQTQQ
ncbi:DUF3592 domain-containing protein [Symmachiella macrocystis]|nr:DUF3592 domain-containing protein [Symmachiella macrocystis]